MMIDQIVQTSAKDFRKLISKIESEALYSDSKKEMKQNSFPLNKLFFKENEVKPSLSSKSIYERTTAKEKELLKLTKALSPVKLAKDYVSKLTCLLQSKNDPEYSHKRSHINEAIYKVNEKNNLCITLPKFNYKKAEEEDAEIADKKKTDFNNNNNNAEAKNRYSDTKHRIIHTQEKLKDISDIRYSPIKTNKEKQTKHNMIHSKSGYKVLFKSSFPSLKNNNALLKTEKKKMQLETNCNSLNDIVKPMNNYQGAKDNKFTNIKDTNGNHSTSPNLTNFYYRRNHLFKNKQDSDKAIIKEDNSMATVLTLKYMKDRLKKVNELCTRMKLTYNSIGSINEKKNEEGKELLSFPKEERSE